MAVTWNKVSFATDEKKMLLWYVGGTVATGAEQGPAFHLDAAYTAGSVYMKCKAAPTGAALIVDINEGSATIFSTRPQIDDGSQVGGTAAVFSDTALADNAEITLDIDQVGSTVAGENLTVILELSVA